MNTIRIQRVTAENYTLFEQMVRRRMGQDDTLSAEYIVPQAIQTTLLNENLRLFAAWDEAADCFVGWISLVYIPKVGRFMGRGHIYVDEVYVEPTSRRKGIAKQLLAKADEMAAQRDATGIRLYVNTQNPGAQLLYSGCGYKADGSAVFMEKSAPSATV